MTTHIVKIVKMCKLDFYSFDCWGENIQNFLGRQLNNNTVLYFLLCFLVCQFVPESFFSIIHVTE
jgi:hypothetical protein